ncbi:MAG: hypothetical protein ACFFDB_00125 [Promethearchaeota archaeon]
MKKKDWASSSEDLPEEGRNKKKLILVISVISIIIFSSVVGVLLLSGSIWNDEEVTWDKSKGDIFYFGLKDDYYWADRTADNDYIREFHTVLKSEILDKKDLETDWDDDPDLIIMSSFLFGDENIYSVEVPNWFDIYQLTTLLYNIDKITNLNPLNTTNLVQWALPNAIHIQSSSIYHHLNALLELYNLQSISQEVPEFNESAEFFEYLINMLNFNENYNETFELYSTGNSPANFTIETNYPDNNTALVISDPYYLNNKVLQLHQDANTSINGKDDLKAKTDIFNWYSYKEIGNRIDLGDYIYQPEYFAFDVQLEGNRNHSLEFALKTEDFNITATINDEIKTWTGYNGINFRLNNGIIEYNVGDYIFSGSSFRKSLPHEKGWQPLGLGFFNASEVFYPGSPYGDRFQIIVKPHFFALYDYEITIRNITGDYYEWSWYTTPLYYDCPYDFLPDNCYDNNANEFRLFRFNNYTEILFNISDTNNPETSDIIDNIVVNGQFYYKMDNFENIVGELFVNNLLFISMYHLLFYPNNFPYSSIASVFGILNTLIDYLLNLSNFFEITDNPDYLKIEITYEKMGEMREIVKQFLLDLFNIETNGFIEGDTDIKFTMVWDKRIGTLNSSIFTFNYKDLGIIRELGMQLVAARKTMSSEAIGERIEEIEEELEELEEDADKNEDRIDELEVELEELKSGMARMYDDYPAYPDDGWVTGGDLEEFIEEYEQEKIDELMPFLIVSHIITGAVAVGISIGIPAMVRWRKRRKERDLE